MLALRHLEESSCEISWGEAHEPWQVLPRCRRVSALSGSSDSGRRQGFTCGFGPGVAHARRAGGARPRAQYWRIAQGFKLGADRSSMMLLPSGAARLPAPSPSEGVLVIFPDYVVMCGGAGARLWPLSRESLPK